MRKKWTLIFLCVLMAMSIGGVTTSFQKTTAEEGSVIQLISEPVQSAQNKDFDWRQAVTFVMGDTTIKSGDILTITYTIDTERGPAMKVGGVDVTGTMNTLKPGEDTWTYTFTDSYSGDILFGVYSSSFTVTSATLTIAGEKEPAEEGSVIQLISEPLQSAQSQDLDWRQAVTFVMGDTTIKSGDILTITYTIDTERGPAMKVGGVDVTGTMNTLKPGEDTWTYTFTDSYSGDILFGVYSSSFTVTSATLTIAPQAEQHYAAIFAGVTKEPESNSYEMGTVKGEIKSDGSLSYGQFEDGTYYIVGQNASITRVDLPTSVNLKQAYLDEAVLKFSAKFDFASEQDRTAELRIMYSYDNGTDRNYAVTELTTLTEFKAGEWVEFALPLYTLSQEVVGHTWGGAATGRFDWTNFRGVGFAVSSAETEGGNNVVSFGNVRVEGQRMDREITGLSIDPPTKTTYEAGEQFDPAGMEVYVNFDDQAKVPVYDYTIEAPEELTKDSVVRIKWDSFTVDVSITVEQAFTLLKIETAPTKTVYKAGEFLDLEGLTIKAYKGEDDEKGELVSLEAVSYSYADRMLPEGVTEIVFTYLGLTVSQPIQVADYENSLTMFGELSLDEDGDPADGWNINSIGNSVVSEATYNAETEENQEKLRKIGQDPDEGLYFTAEASSWAVSRVFEAEVADYNLLTIYEPEYQACVAIRYRATSKTGTFVFGLSNFFDWNLGFKSVDITSYVVADGEWHTMYIDFAEFSGLIDGTLWTDDQIIGKNLDLTKIAGFAVKLSNDTMDIAGVEIKWNGDAAAATMVDTYIPTLTYNGAMSFTMEEGDEVLTFADATAFDNYDKAPEVIVEWPEGAVTDGKVNAGEYTVKLYAKDAAGNESSPYHITVTVNEKEPVDSPNSCASSVSGSALGFVFAALGGAVIAWRKKK